MILEIEISLEVSGSGRKCDFREQINFSDSLAAHAPEFIEKVNALFEDLSKMMRQINEKQEEAPANAD